MVILVAVGPVGAGAARTRRLVVCAVLAGITALVSGALGGTPSARAATPPGLTTGFMDDQLFPSTDPAVRSLWLTRAKNEGVGLIRITVLWRYAVGPTPPQNPTDPSDPSYATDHMHQVDAAVADARARGFDVLLTPWLAPEWAEGASEPADVPEGSWKPNATAFGQFGQMLAERYSGFYGGLPRVSYFEAWNEPNLSSFLTPQWQGGNPWSPLRYRELLNQFYAGVKRAPGDAQVVGGSTAPFGDDLGDPQTPANPRLRPMVFLRKLFCMNNALKPLACPAKPHLDILSHHPVNIFIPPTTPASDPDDVEIADFHKLGTLMDAAERARHVVPAGSHPLWATEIYWLTNPPNPIGPSPLTQARWLEQGMYLLWKQGARVVVNYLIRDQALVPGQAPGSQGSTGVFFNSNKPKPAYTAFRFPFVTERASAKRVIVWSKVPTTGKLEIQMLVKGEWRTVRGFPVDRGQVFRSSIELTSSAYLRGKIRSEASLSWHQN
jgi:hypothetical protein